MSILSGQSLTKSYRRRPIVRGVSLTVHSGEAVALLGPNGAGKTTCFYMLAGLLRPDTGTVQLDETDVTRYPLYRRARLGIGYLPQESSVFRALTVAENILAVLERCEPDRKKRTQKLEALLEEFQLTPRAGARASTLSGGERRRTEIARALAASPRFLLLDEPLAGIDPIAIGEIRTLIRHLCTRGIGVLVTDHNVRDTLAIVDRAYILAEGQILAEGLPEALKNDARVKAVYLGNS